MGNFNDINIKTVECLQDILIRRATGDNSNDTDESEYKRLRKLFLTNERTGNNVPDFVRKCRDLSVFWGFIKPKFSKYKERREFIHTELSTLFNIVEGIYTHQENNGTSEKNSSIANTVISVSGDINVENNTVVGDNNISNKNNKKFDYRSEVVKIILRVIVPVVVLFLITFLIQYFTGIDISLQKIISEFL